MSDRLYKDRLHYNTRRMDSYNKPFNFVICEREAGKTTAIPVTKVYKAWYHHHRPSIILRRNVVDITDTYMTDLQDAINDFLPEKRRIEFKYKKGDKGNGVVDVEVDGRPFVRFIAMSIPKSRIKSLRYDDPAYIIMDESVVDNRHGEKYLKDEAGRFKEIYNTFLRFATRHQHTLKAYFCGNPYSVYNPYFMWWGVDLSKVKPGAFIVGHNYVVECYQIKPELKEWILQHNPLYEFDDSYKRYAFGGEAINDQQFDVVEKQPDGYRLKLLIRVQSKYLYFYYCATDRDKLGYDPGKFWIKCADTYDGSKNVYAADFNNLVAGTKLMTPDMRALTYRLKDSVASRDVSYSSIAAGYLVEAIYNML